MKFSNLMKSDLVSTVKVALEDLNLPQEDSSELAEDIVDRILEKVLNSIQEIQGN